MEYYPKFFKGLMLSALASVFICGTALAVPAPIYPNVDPGSDGIERSADVQAPSNAVTAPGARILTRTGDVRLARGAYRSGTAPTEGAVTLGAGSGSSSKHKYLLSAMVLAALTPLALHYASDWGHRDVEVQTRTPGSGSLTSSGLPSLGGGNGPGDGDRDGDDGDEVCDTGGDSGDGNNAPGDDHGGLGGGGGEGGGLELPEPGTVPLIGAGLMMALAFRSRRGR